MAFGAQIKLSVDQSSRSKNEFRGQVQKLADEVSASNPIKLKNITVELSARQKQQIFSKLQADLNASELKIKIGQIDAKPAIDNLRKQLTTMLSGLSITGLKEFLGDAAGAEALERARKEAEKLAEAEGRVKQQASEAAAAIREINAIQSQLKGLYGKTFGIEDTSTAENLKQEYRNLSIEIEKARNLEGQAQAQAITGVSAATLAYRQKIEAIMEAEQAAMSAGDAEARAAKEAESAALKAAQITQRITSMSKQIESYISNNPKAYNSYKAEFDAIRRNLSDIVVGSPDARRKLSEVSEEFTRITTTAKISGNAGKDFFTVLQEGWKKFGGWSIVTKSMMTAITRFKDMVRAVKDIDAAMTELKKVTDLTDASYNKFYQTTTKTAKQIGATVADTINATADFARLGYNIDDAAALAEAALIYKNVGDGIENISQASESLISTMKAFNIEAENATHIIDAFNEVGNNFAISSTGIGDALQRSAAALAAAGNTLEQSIGLVTAANNVVQNPDQVGTALKTLSMYLRAAKTEAEDAGIATDGMADSVSELREELLALTGQRLDIQIDEDTFKSTYQILEELSEIWEDLTDITRANITELIGGKRNANVLSALLTNFKDAQDAAETAMNSIGSAARENEKYLDSIAGKMAQLKAAFEAFAGNTLDSSFIKFFIDLGTALLNVANHVSKIHMLIPAITALATLARGINAGVKANGLVNQIFGQVQTNAGSRAIIDAARTSLDTLTASQRAFASSQLDSAAKTGILNAALVEQIKKEAGLNEETRKLASAGGLLSSIGNGIKSSFLSLNGIIIGVTAVIGIVINIVDRINKSIQESIDKANELIDTYESAKSTYSSNMKTLSGLEEQFDKLSKGVNENGENVSLTSEEYQTYLSIIDQIADISPQLIMGYTDEGHAILNYKDALQEAISAQKEYIENQRAIVIGNGEAIYTGKRNEYKKFVEEIGKAGNKLGDSVNLGLIDSLLNPSKSDEYVDAWHRALEMIGVDWKSGFDTWGGSTQALIKISDNASQFIQSIRSFGVYSDKEIKNIEQAVYGLSGAATQLKLIAQDQVDYLTTWASVQSWYEDLPVSALDELAGMFAELNNPLDTVKENTQRAAQYGAEFAQYFASENYNNTKEIFDLMSTGASSAEELDQAIQELNNGWEGSDVVLGWVISYWQSLSKTMGDTADIFPTITAKVNALSDSLKRLKEGYSLLETAQKEMDQSGTLSNDTLQGIAGLMGDGEKLSDYIYTENGLLKLNTEAWKARSKAMLEADAAEYIAAIGQLEEQISALEASREGMDDRPWHEGDEESLNGYKEQLTEIETELEIVQAIIDNIDATTQNDPLNVSTMVTSIEKLKSETADLISAYERIQSGEVLTQNELFELAQKYPELLGYFDILSGNAEDAAAAIFDIISGYDEQYSHVIDEQIELLNTIRDDAVSAGYSADIIDNMIANLELMRGYNILDIWGNGGEESAKTLDAFASALKDVKTAASALTDIQNWNAGDDNDIVGMLSTIVDIANSTEMKEAGKTIADFISITDDGIKFNSEPITEWINGIIDGLREIKDESGKQVIDDDLIDQLKLAAEASVEAKSGFDALKNALSATSSASGLIATIRSGDYDFVDVLADIVDIAEKSGKSLEDFLTIGEDGSVNFNTSPIEIYITGLIDSLVEAETITQETADQIRKSLEQIDSSPLDKFSNAISSVKTASSVLTDIQSGNGDPLSILSTIVDIVKEADGTSLDDFLSVDNGKLIYNTNKIEEWVNGVIDGIDASDELKEQLRELAKAADESTSAFEKLGTAISGIESAASFLTNIQSQDGSPLDMIQSAMKMAEELGDGHEWTDFVESFDTVSGIKWNADAVRQYSDSLIDAALAGTNLEETFPGITQYLKDMAVAESEAARSMRDLYDSMQTAISAGNDIGRNTELTLSAYESLISVDARYAQAVDYVNGKLTLNRDIYNDVTNSILEDTLAQVEAAAKTIILGDEYQDLTSRIGTLDEKEQARLDTLNAEIMSYGVLANELANATSAYERFMNSSDDDSRGRYAQAVKALGVISDTLENTKSDIFGKIGRDQFKLAVDFVLGDNVKVNTPEFEKGLELVRRYLTEDAQGVTNFYDDLVKNGIIDAATGAMDTTVSQISQTLGISQDAVRAMLEELERYQENPFDWSKLDPGSEAEEAKTKIETLQEALQAVDDKVAEVNTSDITIETENAVEAVGKITSALSDVLTKLQQIAANSNITVRINTVQSGSVNTTTSTLGGVGGVLSKLFGRSAANGTSSAAGGKTLVGELGMETVIDPKSGKWYTVGSKGPQFVNLPQGAIVLNAAQTSNLFGAGRHVDSGRAMAAGNAFSVLMSDGGGSSSSSKAKAATKTAANTAAKGIVGVVTGFLSGVVSAVGSKTKSTDTVTGTVKKPTTSTTKKSSSSSAKTEAKEVQKLKDKYEELNEQLEHLIEHQEFLYKVADRGLDYKGMEASLQQQARLYRKIMENSYAAVAEMQAQGKDDTDKDLQDMERAAWSAYESMYDAFDKIRALYTDALNDKIDDIQKGYDNLKNVMDQMANNGGISVDAFQALTDHGLQYLSFLQDADGQYQINTDAIEKMIAAEKEQLAVETALSYLSSLKEALGDGQSNRIDALVDATQQISDNSWNAVYAQAALLKDMGLTGDQYNQIIFNIDALRNMAGNVITDLSKQSSDALKEQQNALDKILEFTEDLVEAEVKDRIKAIEEEVKAYRKIIDLKKESLKVTKEENEYERSVTDKVKEIAKIQAQIDQLSLDDSRAARAERAKLVEDLAKLQTDLSDYQSDHAYDAQMDTLDKMAEEYEEKRQTEIDRLEESISSTEKIYQLALDRIRNGWSTLYGDLIAWNFDQGKVINQEITENWNLAGEAVQRYGSYLMALQEIRGLDVGGSLAILPKYHDGGVVGNSGSINDDEVAAILKKGEIVVNDEMKKGLYKIIDFPRILSEKLGVAIGNIGLIGRNVMPSLGLAGVSGGAEIAGAQSVTFSPEINVEINHSGDMNGDDARRYGNEIANTTIDKLYTAFGQRGVSGIFGTRLKQA